MYANQCVPASEVLYQPVGVFYWHRIPRQSLGQLIPGLLLQSQPCTCPPPLCR